MNRLTILTLVSACTLMLVFTAAGATADVVLDYDEDGIVDQTYSNVQIGQNTTAFELLNSACSSLGYSIFEGMGAFIYMINGHTATWDPDQEWYMFTSKHSGGSTTMSEVGVSNYFPVQNGDTIGMWLVSGNHTSWPYSD